MLPSWCTAVTAGSACTAANPALSPAAPAAPPAAAGGDGDGADTDLQLAWENLESAKVIWSRDAQHNAAALADVHGLLGDVAMESDDFGTALAELDAALGHLAGIAQVRAGAGAGW